TASAMPSRTSGMRATSGSDQGGPTTSMTAAGSRSRRSRNSDCAMTMSPTQAGPTIRIRGAGMMGDEAGTTSGRARGRPACIAPGERVEMAGDTLLDGCERRVVARGAQTRQVGLGEALIAAPEVLRERHVADLA